MNKLHLYTVDLNYIDYLQAAEIEARGISRVPNMKYEGQRAKFVCGVVLKVPGSSINYYVGLTSYKVQKSENILITVPNDSKPIKGSLRFNYMFPVPDEMITPLIINNLSGAFYRNLVTKEYRFIDSNRIEIQDKAIEVYNKIIDTENCSQSLIRNSCDFKLLEEAYVKYCEDNKLAMPSFDSDEVIEIIEIDKEA